MCTIVYFSVPNFFTYLILFSLSHSSLSDSLSLSLSGSFDELFSISTEFYKCEKCKVYCIYIIKLFANYCKILYNCSPCICILFVYILYTVCVTLHETKCTTPMWTHKLKLSQRIPVIIFTNKILRIGPIGWNCIQTSSLYF